MLSVQHTDNEVLAATDRSNIPASKYREVVTKLGGFGIACDVQLILGIPGDSVEKWKNCLAEIMNWGIHDNFQISPTPCFLTLRRLSRSSTEMAARYGGTRIGSLRRHPKEN